MNRLNPTATSVISARVAPVNPNPPSTRWPTDWPTIPPAASGSSAGSDCRRSASSAALDTSSSTKPANAIASGRRSINPLPSIRR